MNYYIAQLYKYHFWGYKLCSSERGEFPYGNEYAVGVKSPYYKGLCVHIVNLSTNTLVNPFRDNLLYMADSIEFDKKG